MADFAEQLDDSNKLKTKLINALNKRKPFREFKFVIDNSGEYRQKWFDFKNEQLQQWVKDKFEETIMHPYIQVRGNLKPQKSS